MAKKEKKTTRNKIFRKTAKRTKKVNSLLQGRGGSVL